MSIANPIKIEPRHIYEYNTNIVNNNKIDCVNIEETVNESNISSVCSHSLDLVSINDSGVIDVAVMPKDIKDYCAWFDYTGKTGNIEMFWIRYYIDLDFDNTFLNSLSIMQTITMGNADNDKISLNTSDRNSYIHNPDNSSGVIGFYFSMVNNFTEFLSRPTPMYGGKCALEYGYRGNFKKRLYVQTLVYRHDPSVSTYPINYNKNFKLDFYARKTKRETKSYCLNSAGECVLANTIPNFKARFPYTYPSNELFQEGATNLNKYNNNIREPLSKCIAHSLLYQFKNGKQTASMTVNCTDYYDISGNKVIGEGVDRKTLQAGDYVIPYIKADTPLARHRDGAPKKFEITSAEFEYEGRPEKHLKMVEVVE